MRLSILYLPPSLVSRRIFSHRHQNDLAHGQFCACSRSLAVDYTGLATANEIHP